MEDIDKSALFGEFETQKDTGKKCEKASVGAQPEISTTTSENLDDPLRARIIQVRNMWKMIFLSKAFSHLGAKKKSGASHPHQPFHNPEYAPAYPIFTTYPDGKIDT